MPTEEQWKQIEKFPRYFVSDQGRIKSTIGKEKILKQYIDKKGYCRIKLAEKPIEKGKYRIKEFKVHRLVAKYFCENWKEENEVHHKNLLRQDNEAKNLECLTKQEHLKRHREERDKANGSI